MTSFAISMPCSPPGRWGKALFRSALTLVLVGASLLPLPGAVTAQDQDLAGARGNLFESTAFGFIVMLPEDGGWVFQDVTSDTDGDVVQVAHPSGVTETVTAYRDANGDAETCVQGLLDGLAAANPDVSLTGWNDDEISILSDSPDTASAQALVPDPEGEALFAYMTCNRHPGDLLLSELQLQPPSVVEAGESPDALLVQGPGRGNTGSPSLDGSTPAPGVVLFAARGLPVLDGETSIPFSCLDQESFELPPDPLPEGRGYFACDGQMANIDNQPLTIDVSGFALGCLPGLPVDPEAGACPEEPVRAGHAQVLDTSTGDVDGATVTLDPGEYADLVLWFTLPEGLPPQDVLYIEGDQTFQVGPSYFAAGIGSRPRVRMTR